jgi:ABC-type multidrug transport system fused ATPase/permease subunit
LEWFKKNLMRRIIFKNLRTSALIRAARVLPKSDRPKILVVVALQIGLGFLDLLGVAVFGVLGALSVTGVQSLQPGNRVSAVLDFLSLTNFSFQSQVAILAVSAAAILVLRTLLSIVFTRRIFFFLSRRSATISSSLISKFLSQSLTEVQSRSTQDTLYSVTAGVSAITLGVLGTATTIVSDASLLLIMVVGLFVVDPTIAITTIVFFGTLGLILYRSMNVKAHELGFKVSSLNVKSNEKIIEVLTSYRESVVRNRRDYYAREIGRLRMGLADVLAEMQFMPNISKYVIESGIVIGAILIAGVQFAIQDARHAVATLTVFLAAGTRIAPAIMRLQQSAIQIKSGIGSAIPTLELIESLHGVESIQEVEDSLDVNHVGFKSEVTLKEVSFRYPNQSKNALTNISVSIANGESLAIVGPSGAGKTTFVDVLLGVLKPDSGDIEISSLDPIGSISKWPGAISYVPQDVVISNGTIRENIAMGFPMEVASDELIWDALDIAQLTDFVKALPLNIDTPVGDRGTKISGGQRQRLGIARAMFTKPKLLVLDEATSSLDGQTEADISDAIQNLKGTVTVVLIAHRLSTVRNAGQVMYMADGEVMARGSFEEVRAAVPDFDRQAQLMGL